SSTGTWIRSIRRCIPRRGEGKQPQRTRRSQRFFFMSSGQQSQTPRSLRSLRSLRLLSLCALCLLCALPATAQPQPAPRAAAAAAAPRVRLVATGGTISNRTGGRLTAEDLVGVIPGVDQYARPEYEQFANVASSQLTLDQWLGLSKRINELFATDSGLAGIVVTSGTDTLEETAYFLNLTVRSDRP